MNKTTTENSIILGVLTRFQVAELFHVSVRTIDNWTKQGILKSTKLGGKVLYLKQEILKALQVNHQ